MRGVRMLPLVLVLVLACGGDEASNGGDADVPLVGETAARTAELLAPVRAVSLVEIEAAQGAMQRAERADIRAYAATVASDHRALLTILDSVGTAIGAPLVERGAAQELAHVVKTAHATTEDLGGFDFDVSFVRAEIEVHRQLLDRLDQEFIAAALEPETQTLLRDIRALVDAHMTRSRQLLNVLASAPPPRPPVTVPAEPRPRPTPPQTPTFTPTPRTDTIRPRTDTIRPRTDTVRPPPDTARPPIPPITTSG